MKLLVSDYDDTIKVMTFLGNDRIPKGTIKNINDFNLRFQTAHVKTDFEGLKFFLFLIVIVANN